MTGVYIKVKKNSFPAKFSILKTTDPLPLRPGAAGAAGPRTQLHHRPGRTFLPAARTNARNGGEGASGRLRYSGWPWRPK